MTDTDNLPATLQQAVLFFADLNNCRAEKSACQTEESEEKVGLSHVVVYPFIFRGELS